MSGKRLRMMIAVLVVTCVGLAATFLSRPETAFLDDFQPRRLSVPKESLLVQRLLGSGQYHGAVQVLEFKQDQRKRVYEALQSRFTSFGVNKYYYGRPIRRLPVGYEIFTNRGGPSRVAFAFACNESGGEIRRFAKTGNSEATTAKDQACVVVFMPTESWLDSRVQDVGSYFGL